MLKLKYAGVKIKKYPFRLLSNRIIKIKTFNLNTGKLVPNVSPLLHTIITTSGTADIPIEKKAQTPDVAVVYDIDLSYNLISRDD